MIYKTVGQAKVYAQRLANEHGRVQCIHRLKAPVRDVGDLVVWPKYLLGMEGVEVDPHCQQYELVAEVGPEPVVMETRVSMTTPKP